MDDGFEAMGKPVPQARRQKAYEAVKDMMPGVSTEDAMGLVNRVAEKIERDQPYEALREATDAPLDRPVSSARGAYSPMEGVRLDVIGGYRLLAHLCCD